MNENPRSRTVRPPDGWREPDGFCECGCGERTPIAKQTKRDRDQYRGYPMRYVRGHGRRKRGPDHHLWRGGRFERRGYVMVWADPDDPIASAMADARGYVPEHRLVMAEQIGRPLRPNEHVHHRDEDTTNNDPSNLELLTLASHNTIHHTGRKTTPEQRARMGAGGRRAMASLTPEQRRERARRAAEARWARRGS